jgi:hypothetical protein
VLADAWLPDLVRLGGLESHLGDGVIEAAVDAAVAAGRLKPRQRRRIMSYPLVIRLMLAAGLMPDASYCEALARLAGLLADIPFVPGGDARSDQTLHPHGIQVHTQRTSVCPPTRIPDLVRAENLVHVRRPGGTR